VEKAQAGKSIKRSPILPAQGLHSFSAYAKSLDLFDMVVSDLQSISGKYELTKLIAQQIASADSIAANIEEGYGRESKKRLFPLSDYCPGISPRDHGTIWSPQALD